MDNLPASDMFGNGSQRNKNTREIPVNLNDHIKVKLNEQGLAVYRKYYGGPHYAGPKVDSEGYCEMQLWVFINIFGGSITVGLDGAPFDVDMIIVCDKQN